MIESITEKKWFYILCLIIILGSSLIFRLINISQENFSLDEAFSVHNAQNSVTEITSIIASENYPPLYPYLLHYWLKIFGVSEGSARSLSVIVGLLSIWIMYLLGRAVFNRQTGLWAAFITGISAFHIEFSLEARMYIFVFLFSALTTYFLWQTIRLNKSKYLIWFTLFSIANLYTHFFAIIFLVCQLLFAVGYLLFVKNGGRVRRNLLISTLVIVVGFMPWLPNLVGRFVFFQKGFWTYVIPVKLSQLFSNFPDYFFLSYNYGYNIPFFRFISFLYFILPLILLAFAFNYRTKSERGGVYWKVLFLLILFVLPIAISYVLKLYSPRYLIIITVPLYIILARGIEGLKKCYLRILIVGLIAVLIIPCWAEVLKTHFDWPAVADYISQGEKPGDAIVTYSAMHLYLMEYYYKDDTPAESFFPLAAYGKRDDEAERLKYSGFIVVDAAAVDSEMAYLTRDYDRIWLVSFQQDILDKDDLVKDWLHRSNFKFESRRNFPFRFINEQVGVYLYNRE